MRYDAHVIDLTIEQELKHFPRLALSREL